ncbi:Ku protein [Propionibacteriaceae bacterium Y1923]|uniref:non-homologous end joining protein Ku n=1 Tax=Aestuariimicrobium sp. Y1814 TaxID=3418742 RepID=UPI003C1EAFB5
MAPRSIWKGAISFGLITIPVKVYGATEEKDISFNQVHPADGGRIKYKRVCDKCGEEVPFAEIAKGYTADDGRVAILEKSDFDDLPLASSKSVEVVQFVETEAVDPTYFARTYVLEADGAGAKPYVLLRDAMASTGRAAVVKVALRQREAVALIRATDNVLMMHTMLWPDEIRDVSFAEPPGDVKASKAEVAMATSFINELESEFDPTQFTDAYREALEKVVEAKLSGVPMEEAAAEDTEPAEVVDLVAALKASVAAAKKKREAAAEASRKKAAG